MNLRPGVRLKSAVCSTEIVVVKAPTIPGELRCGGHPMIPITDDRPSGLAVRDDAQGPTQLGKRYVVGDDVEVLCTKAGEGALAFDDVLLVQKEAKALPASD